MDLELDLDTSDDGLDLALDGDGLGDEVAAETGDEQAAQQSPLVAHRRALLAAAAVLAVLVLVAAATVGVAVFFVVDGGDSGEGGESDSNDGGDGTAWSYGVVVDLGSSGSRGHVFQWTSGLDIQAAPGQQPFWYIKIKPGVSSYSDEPEEAALSLVPVLDYCLEHLESVNATVEEVPVFLYATAGLRLVGEEAADAVMEAIRTLVADAYPFRFDSPSWARVIDGAEEATFDWLSAQQLLQLDPSLAEEACVAEGTLGLVDMGGASFEIAFEAAAEEAHEEEYADVAVAGAEYSIYRHSYLGYGHNAAREGLQALLYREQAGEGEEYVISACFLDGYNETLALPEVGDVQYFGSGDAVQCAEAVVRYFDMEACAGAAEGCSIGGTFQPPLQGSFLGIDDLARVVRFYSLNSTATPRQIYDSAAVFCGRPWEAAQQAHAGDSDTGVDLAYYCFEGVYAAQVLVYALGFDWEATNLVIADTLHGVELSWALGAMVYNYPLLA